MKYKKRPVTVEALQYDGSEESRDKLRDFGAHILKYDRATLRLTIETIQGPSLVYVGDFVIKGIQGEFYPCSAPIFEQTYEPLS